MPRNKEPWTQIMYIFPCLTAVCYCGNPGAETVAVPDQDMLDTRQSSAHSRDCRVLILFPSSVIEGWLFHRDITEATGSPTGQLRRRGLGLSVVWRYRWVRVMLASVERCRNDRQPRLLS